MLKPLGPSFLYDEYGRGNPMISSIVGSEGVISYRRGLSNYHAYGIMYTCQIFGSGYSGRIRLFWSNPIILVESGYFGRIRLFWTNPVTLFWSDFQNTDPVFMNSQIRIRFWSDHPGPDLKFQKICSHRTFFSQYIDRYRKNNWTIFNKLYQECWQIIMFL